MENNKKILIMTGGGTGGHIIPNLALLPNLCEKFEIYYLGEENSMEERIMKDNPMIKKFVPIKAVKFVRKFAPKNFFIPIKLIKNINLTKKIIKKINPDIIFAKGGYVSLPVCLAGKKLKIPIFAHESDLSMGLANKIILRFCEVMFTSFRQTCTSNKCVFSGNPIRREIFFGKPEVAERICNFAQKKPVLMFFGGSLGSRKINKFVFSNLDNFSQFNIIHFVGKNNAKEIRRSNYFQMEFSENIYDFFAMADVVVSRAGANSIFELAGLRKLMVLIPLSKKQSRGDQIENANEFKKNGLCEVLEEQDLTYENLVFKIENLQKNKFYFTKNMKDFNPLGANELIAKHLIDFANKHEKKH